MARDLHQPRSWEPTLQLRWSLKNRKRRKVFGRIIDGVWERLKKVCVWSFVTIEQIESAFGLESRDYPCLLHMSEYETCALKSSSIQLWRYQPAGSLQCQTSQLVWNE